MGYGIMRVQKVKMAGVKGIEIHMNREKEVSNTNPDIDFNASDQNIYLQRCDDFRNAVNERISQLGLSRSPRKDATVLVDCLITASPESLKSMSEEQRLNYFADAYKAVQERFGANNVISAVIHKDEPGSEHMDVSFVPAYFDEQGKGHLSAKDLLGGHKEMSQLQTYFYDNVFKNYNLERGVIRGDGEQAKQHMDDARFKASMIAKETEKAKTELAAVRQETKKAKTERDAAMQEIVKLREHISKLEGIETELADREGMNEVIKGYNDMVREIKSVGDQVAQGNLEMKRPAFSKNKNEVSLGSVQRASWELTGYLKKIEPVIKSCDALEKSLSDMKDREQELIENRARELVRQTQEQLQKELRQAQKDRKRYAELKYNEESYIRGTAEAIFDDYIKKGGQEFTGKTQKLEDFISQYTMNGKSLLEVFEEQEKERIELLSQEYDKAINEALQQGERFEDNQIEEYEDDFEL